MTSTVQKIDREAILHWLKHSDVRGYRYKINVEPMWFLVLVGAVGVAAAAVLAHQSHLQLFIHKVAFGFLFFVSASSTLLILRWSRFAARSYLAIGKDAVLVGRGHRGYLIPRDQLTRANVRVERLANSAHTTTLNVEIGDFKTAIHLVGPLANISNMQHFIADILEIVSENSPEDETDEAEDEPEAHALQTTN